MSLDKATGRWCAKLGRKRTKSGKTDGHKFRFTSESKNLSGGNSGSNSSGIAWLSSTARTTHGLTRT